MTGIPDQVLAWVRHLLEVVGQVLGSATGSFTGAFAGSATRAAVTSATTGSDGTTRLLVVFALGAVLLTALLGLVAALGRIAWRLALPIRLLGRPALAAARAVTTPRKETSDV